MKVDNKNQSEDEWGSDNENNNTVKKIILRCEQCNGTLQVNSDRSCLICPYCGSKSLIVENDVVTIERIKTSAQKEIEMEKIKSIDKVYQREAEKEDREEIRKQVEKFRISKFSKFLIVAFLISAIVTYLKFDSGNILSGIISLVQVICFGTSWCMGMNIIKEKRRYIHVLVAIFGIILIIPNIRMGGQIFKEKKIDEIKWDIIFMKDKLPEPNSKIIEIHSNTSENLDIDIHNTSETEYYEYIKACKELGYTVEMDELSTSYDAYNGEGYYIRLIYWESDKKIDINLDAPTVTGELNWSEHNISSILPSPKSKKGIFKVEDNEKNEIIVSNIGKNEFTAYCKKCQERGFKIDSKEEPKIYEAYDLNGNKINLSYNPGNKEMKIEFNYPLKTGQIVWPKVGIGSLLPAPNSLSGKVEYDSKNSYSVYIEKISKEEFNTYIQKCIDAGFNAEMSKYDTSFSADYAEDEEIDVMLSYEGFDIMHIYISGSIKKDYSSYIAKEEKENNSKKENKKESKKENSIIDNKKNDPTSAEDTEIDEAADEEDKDIDSSIDDEKVEPVKTEYEKAYVRKMSNYSIYMMFDVDTKKVIYFVTNDTSVMKGSYSGNFKKGVIINWDEGSQEGIVDTGNGNAKMIDAYGADWDYRICDVEDAQRTLNSLE